MRWLLGDVDWSLGNNRIHCSSGASHHANGWLLRCRTGEEYAKRLVHRLPSEVQVGSLGRRSYFFQVLTNLTHLYFSSSVESVAALSFASIRSGRYNYPHEV